MEKVKNEQNEGFNDLFQKYMELKQDHENQMEEKTQEIKSLKTKLLSFTKKEKTSKRNTKTS